MACVHHEKRIDLREHTMAFKWKQKNFLFNIKEIQWDTMITRDADEDEEKLRPSGGAVGGPHGFGLLTK